MCAGRPARRVSRRRPPAAASGGYAAHVARIDTRWPVWTRWDLSIFRTMKAFGRSLMGAVDEPDDSGGFVIAGGAVEPNVARAHPGICLDAAQGVAACFDRGPAVSRMGRPSKIRPRLASPRRMSDSMAYSVGRQAKTPNHGASGGIVENRRDRCATAVLPINRVTNNTNTAAIKTAAGNSRGKIGSGCGLWRAGQRAE